MVPLLQWFPMSNLPQLPTANNLQILRSSNIRILLILINCHKPFMIILRLLLNIIHCHIIPFQSLLHPLLIIRVQTMSHNPSLPFLFIYLFILYTFVLVMQLPLIPVLLRQQIVRDILIQSLSILIQCLLHLSYMIDNDFLLISILNKVFFQRCTLYNLSLKVNQSSQFNLFLTNTLNHIQYPILKTFNLILTQ
jgi:hypothetical protein